MTVSVEELKNIAIEAIEEQALNVEFLDVVENNPELTDDEVKKLFHIIDNATVVVNLR